MEAILQQALHLHANAVNSLNEEVQLLKAENVELRRCLANYKQNSTELLRKAYLVTFKNRLFAHLPQSGSNPLEAGAAESYTFESFLNELHDSSGVQDRSDEGQVKKETSSNDVMVVAVGAVRNNSPPISRCVKSTTADTQVSEGGSQSDIPLPATAKQSKSASATTTISESVRPTIKPAANFATLQRKSERNGWLNAKGKQTKLNMAAFKQPNLTDSMRNGSAPSTNRNANVNTSSTSRTNESQKNPSSSEDARKSVHKEVELARKADGEPNCKSAKSTSAKDINEPPESVYQPLSFSDSKSTAAVTDYAAIQNEIIRDFALELETVSFRKQIYDSDSDDTTLNEGIWSQAERNTLPASTLAPDSPDLQITQIETDDPYDTQRTVSDGFEVSLGPALASSTQRQHLAQPVKQQVRAPLSIQSENVSDTESFIVSPFRQPRTVSDRQERETADAIVIARAKMEPLDTNTSCITQIKSADTHIESAASESTASSHLLNKKELCDASSRAASSRCSNEPQYKYYETSRKRMEREQHTAFTCRECEQYFGSMQLSEAEKRERLAACSRHRARFEVPSTPEGFWSLDIPSTPPAERQEFEARKRTFEAARVAKRQAAQQDHNTTPL